LKPFADERVKYLVEILDNVSDIMSLFLSENLDVIEMYTSKQ